jgi:hypothetical protein
MKSTNQKGHQGDVQFRTTTLPVGAIKVKQKPIALGEHSGHMHVVTGDVELYEFEGKTFAVVGNDDAFLQHVHESNFKNRYGLKKPIGKADHKPIKLNPGVYEFGIHKKYNPFSKVWEKVID